MGKETGIQWCDSTINIQMGCEGCELIKGQKTPKCYAKVLTDRYAGMKGWVNKFEEPKIFMERIPKMLAWNDLTDKPRENKEWLNGLPRLIFMNDMGDTFSRGMDKDWFADVLPHIRKSSHQYLVLTKWAKRFAEFSERHELPRNIWAGASVTTNKTRFRINHIRQVKGSIVKWLSVEPMWENIDFNGYEDISWMVLGGESGHDASECKLEWIESAVAFCNKNNIPCFVKQLGTHLAKKMGLKDSHGGDMSEFPSHLQIRQFPKI